MTSLSDEIRLLVRERPEHRCEYCQSHQRYVIGRLQVDHIWPLVKGGANSLENLCLACELCNQYKWTQTHAIDPQTSRHVALYHPRKQRWYDHFAWDESGVFIVGLSPTGRVTIQALHLNNELAIVVRRNWVAAGWHPPLS